MPIAPNSLIAFSLIRGLVKMMMLQDTPQLKPSKNHGCFHFLFHYPCMCPIYNYIVVSICVSNTYDPLLCRQPLRQGFGRQTLGLSSEVGL